MNYKEILFLLVFSGLVLHCLSGICLSLFLKECETALARNDTRSLHHLSSLWLQINPQSKKAPYFLARAELNLYLQNGEEKHWEALEKNFQTSIQTLAYSPEPPYFYALAKRSRFALKPESNTLLDWRKWMYEAMKRDPGNYFYPSLCFEESIRFLTNFDFLSHGYPKSLLITDVQFSLKHYAQLKKYYLDDYCNLVSVHFTEKEAQIIKQGSCP